MTQTYPDITEFILANTKPNVKNFIIDSEIVAIDPRTVSKYSKLLFKINLNRKEYYHFKHYQQEVVKM